MLIRPAFRASRLLSSCHRSYATTAASSPPGAPPMLLKIRKDLKTAMQQKDTARLAVLRSLLASTLNASKTSSPVNTDLQMLALLRKTANASKVAKEEFESAGRGDLAQKEAEQLRIMEEYSGAVKMLGEGEVREVVLETVKRMKEEGAKVGMGDVLKRVFGKDLLGEKMVDKGEVAKIVKEVVAGEK